MPEGDQFLFVRTDGDALAVEFVDPDAPPSVASVLTAGGVAAKPGADLRAIAWDPHGSAEEMTVQPNVRHRGLFVTLEQEARDNRRGLWADPSEPTTPTNVEPPRQTAQARPGVNPSENGWACPPAQPIKGQFTTYTGGGRCVYHVPDGERYSATKADRCYATVEDARQDGCVASRR